MSPSQVPTHPSGEPAAKLDARAAVGVRARPSLSGPLFGREDALTSASAALQAGERALVLLGEAGVGKSRLAAELALWCEAGLGELQFPDGVCWVDLAEVRTLDQLAAAAARALGADARTSDPLAALTRLLATRGATLVVLDEADGVATELGPLLCRLRERAGEARFVVTSRVRPRGLMATTLPIAPLRSPTRDPGEVANHRNPAVLLLIDRLRARFGRAVRRGDRALRETLVRVARRVEGLPAALVALADLGPGAEPAAWRAAMDAWLADPASPLGPTPEATAPLRAAFARSWSLLPLWGQASLAQLSLLRGAFSATDATALLDLSPWVDAPAPLAALGALVDASLITPAEDEPGVALPAFRLPAMSRALGQEQLGQRRAIARSDGSSWSGPEAWSEAERRHAAHFSALGAPDRIAALDGPEGAAALERLWLARDELQATLGGASRTRTAPPILRAASALAELVERRGHPELLSAVHGALPRLRELRPDPLELAALLARVSRAHLASGQAQRARDPLGEAIASVPRDGPPELRGRLAALTIEAAGALGADQDAWPKLERALALVQRGRAPEAVASVLLARARWALRVGAARPAAELERAVTLAREARDLSLEVQALTLLGLHARREGSNEESWCHLRVARLRGAQLGPRRCTLLVGLTLADLARALGHAREADALLQEALPPLIAMEDPVGLARAGELPPAAARDAGAGEDETPRHPTPWLA